MSKSLSAAGTEETQVPTLQAKLRNYDNFYAQLRCTPNGLDTSREEFARTACNSSMQEQTSTTRKAAATSSVAVTGRGYKVLLLITMMLKR
jgi:hypothetical protein